MKKFHENNKHKNGYNFDFLTKINPELTPFIITAYGKSTIDFSESKAVKSLNKSLLMAHYGIKYWSFSDDNLCPPIPSRVDYLHHLSDLITFSDKEVKVLDIGTGASLIYPLLGASEFKWNFVATDIDEKSLRFADKIIQENQLEGLIKLRFQNDSTHVLEGVISEGDEFTFTMCNPPFHKDILEASLSNERKTKNLGSKRERNFSGKFNELCYKGGEKAFLHTYLYESSKYPGLSKWFTSLVSKKDNIKSLEASAKKLNVKELVVRQMSHGNKLSRIVCWRF